MDAATFAEKQDACIKEYGCAEKGCTNWQASGYIYCLGHLHGFPRRMAPDDAKRKLELDSQ